MKCTGRVWRVGGCSTAIEEFKTALLDAIRCWAQPLVRCDYP
jgi:hypothetical protein